MLAGKVALANFGTNMGKLGFNILEFSPDQPDEMGLFSKGVVPPAGGGGSQSVFYAEA